MKIELKGTTLVLKKDDMKCTKQTSWADGIIRKEITVCEEVIVDKIDISGIIWELKELLENPPVPKPSTIIYSGPTPLKLHTDKEKQDK